MTRFLVGQRVEVVAGADYYGLTDEQCFGEVAAQVDTVQGNAYYVDLDNDGGFLYFYEEELYELDGDDEDDVLYATVGEILGLRLPCGCCECCGCDCDNNYEEEENDNV